jgi:hypothetical protein
MSLKEKDAAYADYIIDEGLISEDRITGFTFRGWQALSDNYLVINTSRNKDYLIQTQGRCSNLNNALTIRLDRTSSMSLSRLGDSISTMDGIIPEKCFIKAIYPLTESQADDLTQIGRPVENDS